MSVSHSEAGADAYRRLGGFTWLCDDAGRTNHGAGRCAGPHRVVSRQAGTVAKEASERSASSYEKIAKRGEHSDFHSLNDTILDLLHILKLYRLGWRRLATTL